MSYYKGKPICDSDEHKQLNKDRTLPVSLIEASDWYPRFVWVLAAFLDWLQKSMARQERLHRYSLDINMKI
jgi:hypothetical protein